MDFSLLPRGDLKIFGGEFNALLDLSENMGGIIPFAREMGDFKDFLGTNKLFDCVPKNGRFPWKNKRQDY
jgi:hypothetical protein